METPAITHAPAVRAGRSARAYAIGALGPLTIAGAVLWGIAQPWRLTLLHPLGQGFWWLVIEPPVLVAATGIVFWLVVAGPLVEDLEEG